MVTMTLATVRVSLREIVSAHIAREIFLNGSRIMSLPPAMSFGEAMANPDIASEVRKHVQFVSPEASPEAIDGFLTYATAELVA